MAVQCTLVSCNQCIAMNYIVLHSSAKVMVFSLVFILKKPLKKISHNTLKPIFFYEFSLSYLSFCQLYLTAEKMASQQYNTAQENDVKLTAEQYIAVQCIVLM